MPLSPADLLVGQVSESDFREYVHGTNSIRVDSFSLSVADLTMQFQIPGDKLKASLQWILGVSYMDSGNKLHRTLPMFHPVYPWCWAKSVQVQGMQYDGDDTAAVVWEYQSTPAKWKKYDVTVTFEMPDYNVLSDDAVTYEYERFLSKTLEPELELVSIDNGEMLYEANAGDAFNNQPHAGATPVARRDFAGVKLIWHQVPLEYVQSDDDSLPTKLMQVQGKVNSASFLGQDAETLLCNKVRLHKSVAPLITDTLGQLYFMYDVEIDLLWTKQLDADIGKTGETRRGHNLVLGPNRKYWAIKTTGNVRPFSSVDFAKIFTHHSDSF